MSPGICAGQFRQELCRYVNVDLILVLSRVDDVWSFRRGIKQTGIYLETQARVMKERIKLEGGGGKYKIPIFCFTYFPCERMVYLI